MHCECRLQVNGIEFYKVLELDDYAHKDDVKKAYCRLALTNHPVDIKWIQHSGIQDKFKAISKAYAVLSVNKLKN